MNKSWLLLLLLFTPLFASAVNTTGVVAVYHLNYGSGTTLYDSLGGQHIVGNQTWSTDAKFGAYSANFTGGKMANASTNFQVESGNYTYMAWAKPTSSFSTAVVFSQKSNGHASYFVHTQQGASTNSLECGFYDGVDNPHPQSGVMAVNSWNLVVCVLNVSKSVHAFLNTSQGSNSVSVVDAGTNGNTTFTIGGNAPSPNWEGLIQEVIVFNRSLSRSEVLDLWNAGSGYAYPFYVLNITKPTGGSPTSVTYPQTLSVNFTVNLTTSLVTNASVLWPLNVTVGGLACPVSGSYNGSCTGTTPVCNNYNSSSSTCSAIGCSFNNGVPDNTGYWNWTTSSNPHATTFSNTGNAGLDDNLYSSGAAGAQVNFSGFNVTTVGSGAVIGGITLEIAFKASANTGTNELFFRVSNGTHWSVQNTSGDVSQTEATRTYGAQAEKWGLTWNGNISLLQVNLTSGATSTRTMDIDRLRVVVNYTTPTNCTGTANACSTWNTNPTTCALACTYNAPVDNRPITCSAQGMCQVNCSIPDGLTDLQDLNVSANYTHESLILSDLEVGAVQYAGGVPDINFSIWNGSQWLSALQYAMVFRCSPTQTNCEPMNQTAGSSQSIYRVCNNGTGSLSNVTFYMNPTCSNIALMCDDDYTTAGYIGIDATERILGGSLAVNACTPISCWANYSNPTAGCSFDTYANYTI